MAHIIEKEFKGKGWLMRQKEELIWEGGGRGARARDQVHGALTNIPIQPSGVAGSRAQRATLRQSSSPQTHQQVKHPIPRAPPLYKAARKAPVPP